MENKTNIPKLRFLEFSGGWNKDRFGKLTYKSREKFNPLSSQNLPCIELDCIEQETGILLNTYNSSEQKSIKNRFHANEVLFGKLRPYLKKFYKPNFEGVCSSEIWVLIGDKISNDFLYYLINTPKFNFEIKITSGSKMPRADWDYISEIIFNYPTSEEQQKIASFLSAVDKKLEQLQQKKELLEQYKKGMMQKLFSQQLRFKDDNGNDFPEWEEKELGEIGFFQTSSVDKLSREDEKQVYLINYMNVYKHENITKENITDLQKVTAKQSQILSNNLITGDILFTPSSETPEDIGHSIVISEDLPNTLYSYHVLRFRPRIRLNLSFSHYFCNIPEVLSQLSKYATGSTRFTISTVNFAKVKVKIPNIKEQAKIADFLTGIDAKIDVVGNEIEGVKNFKKGLLQQMFV